MPVFLRFLVRLFIYWAKTMWRRLRKFGIQVKAWGQYRQNLHCFRIRLLPRYTQATTRLLGSPWTIVDGASFLSMYDAIFKREIYHFQAPRQQPRIIDCGANIGLSLLYFKRQFPQSRITAFEPDPKIFSILSDNMNSHHLEDVTLINKALWNTEGTMSFQAEGTDAGRLQNMSEKHQVYEIETTRLRPYLNEPVDFLKMDIEGAETRVLEDCADLLGNVQNLFVEYHSFVDQPQSLPKLLLLLTEAGFRISAEAELPIGRQPFIHHAQYLGMDMQLNIFAYRET